MSESPPRKASFQALRSFGTNAETLWTRIAPAFQQGTRRTIVFVGTEARAGTSTVAACVAVGLARHLRARVMLVEVGNEMSGLAPLLGLPLGPGLTELLRDGASVKNCVNGSEVEGLEIVTSGVASLPAGSLASERAARVFEELGSGRDFLLIDAPPLQQHPELHPLLLHAREAVLVLAAEQTQRDAARELLETIGRAGLTVLGCVLNRARSSPFD